MKKIVAFLSALSLAILLGFSVNPNAHAQLGAGILGLAATSTNHYPSPAASDSAGTVTNPANNGIIDISGGPVACPSGAEKSIIPSTISLVLNQTYLVVFNCSNSAVYAKTAVTAPGGQSASTAPGTPGTYLAAEPGVEVSLAKVVCGSTNCGDTSNGTITDTRSASQFPNGKSLQTIAFADLSTTAATGSIAVVSGATLASAPAACTTGSATVLAFFNGTNWICE